MDLAQCMKHNCELKHSIIFMEILIINTMYNILLLGIIYIPKDITNGTSDVTDAGNNGCDPRASSREQYSRGPSWWDSDLFIWRASVQCSGNLVQRIRPRIMVAITVEDDHPIKGYWYLIGKSFHIGIGNSTDLRKFTPILMVCQTLNFYIMYIETFRSSRFSRQRWVLLFKARYIYWLWAEL